MGESVPLDLPDDKGARMSAFGGCETADALLTAGTAALELTIDEGQRLSDLADLFGVTGHRIANVRAHDDGTLTITIRQR